jgi:hypothetical protein
LSAAQPIEHLFFIDVIIRVIIGVVIRVTVVERGPDEMSPTHLKNTVTLGNTMWARGERGLKDWAKFPAKTAQKRDEANFLQQTTSRIKDGMLLDRSNRIFGYLFDDTRRREPVPKNLPAEELGPYRLRYKVPRWLFRLTDGECIFIKPHRNKYHVARVIDPYLL